MPPKSLPPAAKQAMIVSYLRSSMTVHTVKELEKALPSIASINSMQVKDYLQALSDENMIKVEKIGSGNWYWSFGSDELKKRENDLAKLREERLQVYGAVDKLKADIADRNPHAEDAMEREALRSDLEGAKLEVEGLKKELDGYRDGDPVEVLRKREETEGMKGKAERWTDNIYCLEEYLKEMTGGDRDAIDTLKRSIYGDEYVEGEGLGEWA